MTWGLLGGFLGLSWSLLGAPAASRASKSDVQSLFNANMSSQLAFGAPKITSQLSFRAPKMTISISISISLPLSISILILKLNARCIVRKTEYFIRTGVIDAGSAGAPKGLQLIHDTPPSLAAEGVRVVPVKLFSPSFAGTRLNTSFERRPARFEKSITCNRSLPGTLSAER